MQASKLITFILRSANTVTINESWPRTENQNIQLFTFKLIEYTLATCIFNSAIYYQHGLSSGREPIFSGRFKTTEQIRNFVNWMVQLFLMVFRFFVWVIADVEATSEVHQEIGASEEIECLKWLHI